MSEFVNCKQSQTHKNDNVKEKKKKSYQLDVPSHTYNDPN